ncbi:hypothetical protein PPL_03550 [Heterostelium album PN500]|uniref:NadR/Ttd14 AAA domain-containing protein n=1 Tax=Heterostelium pallidum (strain ATCC 26659 / Pp 5 / PN500) TaxID=670386 RepID=D3B539_HETP5|nr:hypothetical protein PPL_03550 [Heterostelium album PN500]EFA83404.1 hypothetical protein PPL_03550 [Heterostelium album PN500]|eukprot:XP_020435521.1 hypothetical protein PPL_03550 [Heterostelium album PN500]
MINNKKETILKICFIGGESVFKTTVSKRLATHFNTSYVEEYARIYFKDRDFNLNPFVNNDFINVCKGQLELEQQLMVDNHTQNLLMCDTCPLATLVWSDTLIGSHDPLVEQYIDYSYYHLYLLLDCNGVKWVDDGELRLIEDSNERIDFQARLEQQLKKRSIPYHIVKGDLEQREKTSINIINELISKTRLNNQ